MRKTRCVVLLITTAVLALVASATSAPEDAPAVALETIEYENLTATQTGEWLLLVVAPWSLASRQLLAEAGAVAAAARGVRPALRVAAIARDGEDRAVRHMLAVDAYPAVVHACAGVYRAYTDAAALRRAPAPAIAAWLTALSDSNNSSGEDVAAVTKKLDPFAPGERRHVRWLHLVSVVGTEGQHLLAVFSVKPLMLFSCVARALALAVVIVLGLVFCARRQPPPQTHAVRFVAEPDGADCSSTSSGGTEDSEYDFVEYYVEEPGSATPKKIVMRRRKKKKRSQASKSRSRSKSHASSRSRSRK